MGTQIGHKLTPSKTKLGRFIRTRRLKLGLSQVQLAKSAGANQTGISALETGKTKRPKEKLMRNLAEALKCELAELKKFVPKKLADEPTTELGKLIKSRLQALGLTPDDLTEMLEVSENCVNDWLTGQSLSISYKLLKPLAKALKLKPADLSEFALKKNKPAKTAFGQMIRQRRQERGWSGPVLAEKVGITCAGISLIERKGVCSNKLAKKLARKLGLNPADLLVLKPERKKRVSSAKSNT